MIVEDGKIIEATRLELYRKYLAGGWDYITTFPDYLRAMETAGVTVTKEERSAEKKTTLSP